MIHPLSRMKKTVITEYEIHITRAEAGNGRFRAAFLTDLHNAVWNNDPLYLPRLIKAEKPDLILCGGDMIIAHPEEKTGYARMFMKRMLRIAPVYFAPGNHEYRSRIYPETYGTMYEDFIGPLRKEGMTILENASAEVQVNGVSVRIYGLEIPRENYRRFRNVPLSSGKVKELLGPCRKESVSILLAHNPKYYRDYLKWGADLTLCGHYHGGIGRIGKNGGMISPGLMPFPKYACGRIDRAHQSVITGAGLGEHTLPFRINNPRELVMLNVEVHQ